MPEIIEIKRQERPSTERYFRYIDPNPPTPPSFYGLDEYGVEYKGFLVVRSDREYLLWEVKLKDMTDPPIKLRGFFTSQGKTKEAIDAFHLAEEKEKEKAARKGKA